MNQILRHLYWDYKIGVIQWKPVLGEKASNLFHLSQWIKTAKDLGADFVLLPELATTGYVFQNRSHVLALAEENKGESFEFLSHLARKLGIYLIYGYPEKEGDDLYNSQNLIGCNGEFLGTYRKTHLFFADRIWARAGNLGYKIFKTDLGKVSLGICMDMNFQSFIEFHQANRSDFVAISSYWLNDDCDSFEYWLSRWVNFGGTVAISNSYGWEGGIEFSGKSCVFQQSQVLGICSKASPQVLVTSLSKQYALQKEGANF